MEPRNANHQKTWVTAQFGDFGGESALESRIVMNLAPPNCASDHEFEKTTGNFGN